MTVKQVLEQVYSQLQTIYSKGESDSITHLVVEYYTGISRSHIKSKSDEALNEYHQEKIDSALLQLLQHKPVQYILGEAWFYNLRFFVNENVLISRPETEELVQWIVNSHSSHKKPIQILEIGTGSGCISLALKKALIHTKITAIDISEKALEVARQNAATLQADINFLQLDFLNEENWLSLPSFDIIVSNPPYIPQSEKQKMDANVGKWEPALALFVPDNDALLFYKKIALFGKTHLQNHAEIFVECHQHYAAGTKVLFEKFGYTTELKKDIFENDRMVRAGLIL